jgi:hypothetical protein
MHLRVLTPFSAHHNHDRLWTEMPPPPDSTRPVTTLHTLFVPPGEGGGQRRPHPPFFCPDRIDASMHAILLNVSWGELTGSSSKSLCSREWLWCLAGPMPMGFIDHRSSRPVSENGSRGRKSCVNAQALTRSRLTLDPLHGVLSLRAYFMITLTATR